ncbi:MAG: capsular biosynthesis protein [Chitinophagaceae bacterium]|nr:MAG: capsular biosynthesis protein [Chitinophagaceae bacterium]
METAALLAQTETGAARITETISAHCGAQRLAVALLPSPLERRVNRLLKRGVDVLAATVFILFVFPWFLPLAALLISLESRGPVFFRQRRHKQNGDVFGCIKLRTMLVNPHADTLAAFEGDQRITRIGRILRRSHLDELPQLFNVLLGDMSLVGPRPHMLSENAVFSAEHPSYRLRNQVKPGITGLAQVRGLVGATSDAAAIERRLLSDLHYIRHWSPRMDTRILLATMSGFFRNKKQHL